MEFKNCEERILWELSQAEEKIAYQEEVIQSLNQKIEESLESYKSDLEKFQKLKDIITSVAVYKKCANEADDYIAMDYIWKFYNSELFDTFLGLVPGIQIKEREN